MARKIVHVIGTGTIGEPLIGILCDMKEDLGIDEVTFHKNTPLTTDRSKVTSLLKRGARLCTHKDKFDGFIILVSNQILVLAKQLKELLSLLIAPLVAMAMKIKINIMKSMKIAH